ncbi:MAG: amidohydrolase family protein [Salinivirgaceae bacterium]|nr:amidohydrolase family protein [Salinivirgaceae bacterium]
MRKIASHIIYPIASEPIKNSYLVLDDDGIILDLVNTNGNLKEIAGLEYYSGVLVPGFVNAHCHLELSHLKDAVKPGLGLTHFILQIPKLRIYPEEIIRGKAEKQLRYMWSRGISGLGDIMNTDSTISLKKKTPIRTYNFVELFNLGNRAETEIINTGKLLFEELSSLKLKGEFTPHSKYAVSKELLQHILKQKEKKIASVHFLEHLSEKNFSFDDIIEFLNALSEYENVLLIHNLYLTAALLQQIMEQPIFNKLFWVLCPNSNLFIENQLPNMELFANSQLKVCLGTDSLASNKQLSILEEMKTLVKTFPNIAFNDLIKWATQNGAEALSMNDKLGSFEKGKKPGVLLLSNFDFNTNQITQKSEVTRLL